MSCFCFRTSDSAPSYLLFLVSVLSENCPVFSSVFRLNRKKKKMKEKLERNHSVIFSQLLLAVVCVMDCLSLHAISLRGGTNELDQRNSKINWRTSSRFSPLYGAEFRSIFTQFFSRNQRIFLGIVNYKQGKVSLGYDMKNCANFSPCLMGRARKHVINGRNDRLIEG